MNEGDKFKLGDSECRVIEVSGHTLGHICYYFSKESLIFCGDTLFSLGCGRIFEGSYDQMFNSLKLIKNFSKDTLIYFGHEYTFQNSKFCSHHDPNNIKLKIKF